ncbi:MAG: Nif3-like dinuclear metal center hexameric protein [Gammaproteobacteria bacterium]|nr:MAG: Nif3-like dinuclear metal center hexameric protein [Gammaproteobacteria bacterium]
MGVSRTKLENYLNELLQPWAWNDYCPNGLQVEGCDEIGRIVTGVTATQALIDAAIERQAHAILVHHGYFWKGEDAAIRGMKRQRLAKLLAHDINLFAYHLPLDVHDRFGNNVQLAARLGIKVQRRLEPWNKQSVAMKGKLTDPISVDEMAERIEVQLGRAPLVIAGGDHPIRSVAWCTGGGQHYIDAAAAQGIDAFISGEVSEQTVHVAREMGVHFFAAGHHATERYGAMALGEHLQEHFGLDVEFVDIDNPV